MKIYKASRIMDSIEIVECHQATDKFVFFKKGKRLYRENRLGITVSYFDTYEDAAIWFINWRKALISDLAANIEFHKKRIDDYYAYIEISKTKSIKIN